MTKQTKIELTGWNLLEVYPIFNKINRQQLVTCKATYNLSKIMKLATRIIIDEQLIDKHADLIKKYAEPQPILNDNSSDEERYEATRIKLDMTKEAEFFAEADPILNVVYTIDYAPISIDLIDDNKVGLVLTLDEMLSMSKIIVD